MGFSIHIPACIGGCSAEPSLIFFRPRVVHKVIGTRMGGGEVTGALIVGCGGDVCTRSCGFGHIATGRPPTLDLDEPRRIGPGVAI